MPNLDLNARLKTFETDLRAGGSPGLTSAQERKHVAWAREFLGSSFAAAYERGVDAIGGSAWSGYLVEQAVAAEQPVLHIRDGSQQVKTNIGTMAAFANQLAKSGRQALAAQICERLVECMGDPAFVPDNLDHARASWVLDEYAALAREVIYAVSSLDGAHEAKFRVGLPKVTGLLVQATERLAARSGPDVPDHIYVQGAAHYLDYLAKATVNHPRASSAYQKVGTFNRRLQRENMGSLWDYQPDEFHTSKMTNAADERIYESRRVPHDMQPTPRLSATLTD